LHGRIRPKTIAQTTVDDFVPAICFFVSHWANCFYYAENDKLLQFTTKKQSANMMRFVVLSLQETSPS
jgi:hypothetical protein